MPSALRTIELVCFFSNKVLRESPLFTGVPFHFCHKRSGTAFHFVSLHRVTPVWDGKWLKYKTAFPLSIDHGVDSFFRSLFVCTDLNCIVLFNDPTNSYLYCVLSHPTDSTPCRVVGSHLHRLCDECYMYQHSSQRVLCWLLYCFYSHMLWILYLFHLHVDSWLNVLIDDPIINIALNMIDVDWLYFNSVSSKIRYTYKACVSAVLHWSALFR